jgi:hypothetical protein
VPRDRRIASAEAQPADKQSFAWRWMLAAALPSQYGADFPIVWRRRNATICHECGGSIEL